MVFLGIIAGIIIYALAFMLVHVLISLFFLDADPPFWFLQFGDKWEKASQIIKDAKYYLEHPAYRERSSRFKDQSQAVQALRTAMSDRTKYGVGFILCLVFWPLVLVIQPVYAMYTAVAGSVSENKRLRKLIEENSEPQDKVN